MLNKNRPVNLDLSTIRLPVTARVSILHRISGVALLGGVIILLWALDQSLESPESYASLMETLKLPLVKLFLWAILTALAYHFVMGVRHLLMDLGIGESLQGGRAGAKIALVVAIVLIILAGVWVW